MLAFKDCLICLIIHIVQNNTLINVVCICYLNFPFFSRFRLFLVKRVFILFKTSCLTKTFQSFKLLSLSLCLVFSFSTEPSMLESISLLCFWCYIYTLAGNPQKTKEVLSYIASLLMKPFIY